MAGVVAVVGLLLVSAAVLGPSRPLQAQEGEGATGPTISLHDLSAWPTHTTVDRFEVQVADLTAAATYDVRVASDQATALGIGGCGQAAQTVTVTGVSSQTLPFVVYACAVGAGTVTATVRRAGGDAAAAVVTQRLTVLAIPDHVPADERPVRGAAGAAAQVGRPGIVPRIRFPDRDRTSTSFKVVWDAPSNGGRALTGYGVLRRQQGHAWPPYRDADVVGESSITYRGLRPDTGYEVRVHACNGADSCGWWSAGHAVRTRPAAPPPPERVGPPGAPESLRSENRTATAVTIRWNAADATGGAALTGFGILRWQAGAARPPDGAAMVVGAATRSRRVTGLMYGRGQEVRIRACNGPNRCSGWARLTVPPMAGLLPTLGLPKTTIAIGERMSVGANDVPVGATAAIRLEGPIQPERGCAAAQGDGARGAAPRPSTGPGYYDSAWIEGCAPGGDAVIRLEAPDGSVLYDRRTLRVESQRPGRVARPVVRARHAALEVDWEAPTDGGTPTRYDVRHREGASGPWTTTQVRGRTATTITSLTNGRSYQVQVQACNASGCGEWSATVRGTPVATAPAPTDPTTPITPVDASCPETTSTATAAGPPQNLDVVPQSNRRVLLCWSPVTPVKGKTSYFVEATLNPTADTDRDRMWATARTSKPEGSGPPSTTDTAVIVDLTNVLLVTADRGLTMQESVGFRVRAMIDTSRSEYSDMIVVVDSPIVAASVSASNPEEAHVSWRTAQTVLLDADYADGTYDLRYRLALDHRQNRNWMPGNLGPRETETGVASPYTLEDIEARSIYAIQLVYRKDNKASTHDADVYAARYVYVHTVEDPPVGICSLEPAYFAGVPMRYPTKTSTFEYRVCAETFPTGQATAWTEFIKHAFGQWELATNHTVISMRYSNDPCIDYATTDVTATILKKIRDHTGSNEDLTTAVKSFIRRATTMTKLRPLHHADSRLNEVLMLDDVEALGLGSAFKSRVVWVYSQLGSDIGYLGSESTYSADNRCWRDYSACATPAEIVDSNGFSTSDGYTTDIFVLRSRARRGLQLPGGDTAVDRSDVKLNQCPAGTSETYGVLVHEAGHALGLRRADGADEHPRLADSVMSGGDYGNKCAPYPLDVLAIRALYETR